MNEKELREQIRTLLEDGPMRTFDIYERLSTMRIYQTCRHMEDEGILRSRLEPRGPEWGDRMTRVYSLFYTITKPEPAEPLK